MVLWWWLYFVFDCSRRPLAPQFTLFVVDSGPIFQSYQQLDYASGRLNEVNRKDPQTESLTHCDRMVLGSAQLVDSYQLSSCTSSALLQQYSSTILLSTPVVFDVFPIQCCICTPGVGHPRVSRTCRRRRRWRTASWSFCRLLSRVS